MGRKENKEGEINNIVNYTKKLRKRVINEQKFKKQWRDYP